MSCFNIESIYIILFVKEEKADQDQTDLRAFTARAQSSISYTRLHKDSVHQPGMHSHAQIRSAAQLHRLTLDDLAD